MMSPREFVSCKTAGLAPGSLTVRAGALLLASVLNCLPCARPETQATTQHSGAVEAQVRGKIVDRNGSAVANVEVRLFYLRPDNRWPYELTHVTSDADGRYEFAVTQMLTYFVEAGGAASTNATSDRFDVTAFKAYDIDDLVVRPASESCKGRLTFEDGRPAAMLPYGYMSKSLQPIDDAHPPKTNARGEFAIKHLLPDEPFALWLFPKPNTLCVWRKLDPRAERLELRVKTNEYIELPGDWRPPSTHLAFVRYSTFARDSKVRFSLPDVDGNTVSLEDERFRNKVVMVNIYGSWCGGCLDEIPYLVDLKKRFGKEGLEVVGIAFEKGSKQNQIAAIKKISRRYKVNYPLLIGGPRALRAVESVIDGLKDFAGYPTTLYIDRRGAVKYIRVGFWAQFSEVHTQWELKRMEERVRSLLKPTTPPATQPGR